MMKYIRKRPAEHVKVAGPARENILTILKPHTIALLINIVANAIVALLTIVLRYFFVKIDLLTLSSIASFVVILVLIIFLIIYNIRKYEEAILLAFVFILIAILTILAILIVTRLPPPQTPLPPPCAEARPIGRTLAPQEELLTEITTPLTEGRPIVETESFSIYPSYDPSGYMGDTGDITIVDRGPEMVSFTYEARGRCPHEWNWKYINGELNLKPAQFAGIIYLSPPNNFGQEPGFDLRTVRRCIKWEARSTTGEVNVEFIIGGINWIWRDAEKVTPRCPDSLRRQTLGTKTLNDKWQAFEEDLSNIPKEEFKNVIGGFAWVISWGSNEVRSNETGKAPEHPKTFTIEIRNIRYER